MPRTTIPWGDGSGDNIYLDYEAAAGDQAVGVSSDANTGVARSKSVTFSASGVTPVVLTVAQEGVPQTLAWQAMTHPQDNRSSKYIDVAVKKGDVITVRLNDYSTWRFAGVVLTAKEWGSGNFISDTGWQTSDLTKVISSAETGYYFRITISRVDNGSFSAADAEAVLAEATAARPNVSQTTLSWESAVVNPSTRYYRFLSVKVQTGDEITVRLNNYSGYNVGCAITKEANRSSIYVSDTGWQTSDINKIINPRESGYYCHFVVRRSDNGTITVAEGDAVVAEYKALRDE